VQQKPDVIVVTRDFITGVFYEWEAYQDVLRVLSEAAPTFAVWGNHDGHSDTEGVGGWTTRAQMTTLTEGSGMTLLYNEGRRIEMLGQAINLFGVGNLWKQECFPHQAFAQHGARKAGDDMW
jgi:predicted MPP superfamily phosphohydrolase